MDTRSWQVPIPVAPIPPDFSICSPWYGEDLDALDCRWAAGNLPWGSQPVPFRLDRQPSVFVLPMSVIKGQQK